LNRLFIIMLFLFFSITFAHQLYCPNQSNYKFLDGAVWTGNGWKISGEGRVYGTTAFNMVGGYVEFDMDTSGVHNSVNSNFYTISPDRGHFPNYCDIQACNDNSCPFCMEMDIVENNGNCCSASTIHTWTNYNGGCDRGGCQAIMHSSNSRHFKASFDSSGLMKVNIGGQDNGGYNPWPSGNSNNQVKSTMESIGAVLISTMWYGWVPDAGCPSGGADGLPGSVMTVSNVKVYGSVVQGGTPPLCSGPGPTPTPDPKPTPTPGKNCPASVCSWEQCSSGAPWICFSGQAFKGCAASAATWSNSPACQGFCDTRTCGKDHVQKAGNYTKY